MTASLLIELGWKSAVTSGLALILLAALRHRSAAERSWVAHAGLVATLLIPAAVLLLPAWHVVAPDAAPLFAERVTELPDLLPSGNSAALAALAPDRPAGIDLALFLYALPAALLLGTMLVAVARLFPLRARAAVLVEQSWLSALAHAQARMGFRRGTALLVSREVASPISWGVLHPTIVVNEGALASHGEAEGIIAHELAHLARLDWAKLLIARIATALFWFNPLVWMLAHACHQLREEAADDAVLRSDVGSIEYAALLVGAARHERSGLLLAANGVAPGRGSLGRRVRRVLDGGSARAPARLAWALACAGGAMAVAAPLSALTTPPREALASFQFNSGSAIRPLPATTPAAAAPATRPAQLPAAAAKPKPIALARANRAAPPAPPAPMGPPAPPPPPAAPSLPAPEELVAEARYGIEPGYARAIAAVGPAYAALDARQILVFHMQGITAGWLQGMKAAGYDGLTAGQAVALMTQGVSPRFILAMAEEGYRGLSLQQLVAMRLHGVTPALARSATRHSSHRPSADQLIQLAIFGDELPGHAEHEHEPEAN